MSAVHTFHKEKTTTGGGEERGRKKNRKKGVGEITEEEGKRARRGPSFLFRGNFF